MVVRRGLDRTSREAFRYGFASLTPPNEQGAARAAMTRQKTSKLLTADDVRELLRAEIRAAGTQSNWARQKGVNRSIVCSILAGGATLQPKVVKALGLKKIVAYTHF
jgi:hypothetical protein